MTVEVATPTIGSGTGYSREVTGLEPNTVYLVSLRGVNEDDDMKSEWVYRSNSGGDTAAGSPTPILAYVETGAAPAPGRVDDRDVVVTTLLGPVTLQRAYYHCDACRSGVCPRDQALGLQGSSLSPAITRLVGLTAAEGSFAKASEWLTALAGVDVETRQVERCAEALGRDIADDERSVTEQTAAAPVPTMYLGLDGTGVPVRPTEVEGRRGKQPDGSAKTREVKLATVWTAEGRDTQGHPVRDLGSVSYNAAVESAASRGQRHHRAALLHPQRTLQGLLGAASRKRRLTLISQ